MQVDKALEKLGNVGLWQGLVYTGWSISCCFTSSLVMMAPIFFAAYPEKYHCRLSENDTNYDNLTQSCHMLKDNGTKSKCENGMTYVDLDFDSSIITEWDLVCSRGFYGELTITLSVLGGILGSFFLPIFADKFGRKLSHYIFLFLFSVIEASHVFSQNYTTYAILRVVSGFFASGMYVAAFVAACECLPAKNRTFGGIFIQVWWALGMFFLCLVTYFVRNWRHLQLIVALLPLGPFIYVFFIPESIPWLASNGKVEEAEKILLKAAKMNKVEMPTHPLKNSDVVTNGGQEIKVKRAKTLDLFTNRVLRKNLMSMCSLWFANTLVYWGISYTSTMLTSDRYLNFFFNALIEIPAFVFCFLALKRWGRRLSLFLFFSIAGASLLIVIFVPKVTENGVDLKYFRMFLTMVGKWAITSSFNGAILYTTEIFPTNARNTGFGMCTFISRLGAMVAPYSLTLTKLLSWLPGVIFSIVSFSVAFTCLFLPETLNRPLPETIAELEAWDAEQKFWSFALPRVSQDLQREDTEQNESFI